MVFGTFDILHEGHLYLFSEAKKFGNYLIVVVGRDKTVKKIKGRNPQNNENIRLENVAKISLVDKAVLGDIEDQYKVLEKYKPDIICLGYDQKSFITENLEKEIEKRGIKTKIVNIGPYREDIYKSSKMKEQGDRV